MKKILLLTLVFAMLLSVFACGGNNNETSKPFSTTIVHGDEIDKTTSGDATTNGTGENPPAEDLPDFCKAVEGLNEMIVLTFASSHSYSVYYKKTTDGDYIKIDDQLIIQGAEATEAYILGLSAGEYDVKVEFRGKETNDVGHFTVNNISVYAQDRSGYAHFGATEGVGAYNNDGTVKAGTKVIYVTNANKNTVTCEINGEVYTGLVNILQAQYKSSTPMLVRIIGKITTNQWNYKNVEPRLTNGSNSNADFFNNTFSSEYGENLANLIVKINNKGSDPATYNYRTTPTGLTDVRVTGTSSSTTTYKGSDFPSLSGKTVYDDDSYYNMLEVKGSKNITVEGIGVGAEIFQFGISFEECSSIEIKNLTFTDYPEDALNFLGGDRADLANFGRYWIHNCTLNRGYNAWDISGERDKYAGDGSIDFNNVSYTTLAYNYYNNSKKSMLFGSGDSQACMNMTMHHNYFYKVESRLPLGRNVNIHSYNNYFEECKNCSDLRKSSYIFSESNYFKSTTNPFILNSSYSKSFGDIFDNCGSVNGIIVTDRTKTVTSTCKPDNSTNMANFDTSSTLFYYDSANKCSDVSILLNADEVPEFVQKHAGANKLSVLIIE